MLCGRVIIPSTGVTVHFSDGGSWELSVAAPARR